MADEADPAGVDVGSRRVVVHVDVAQRLGQMDQIRNALAQIVAAGDQARQVDEVSAGGIHRAVSGRCTGAVVDQIHVKGSLVGLERRRDVAAVHAQASGRAGRHDAVQWQIDGDGDDAGSGQARPDSQHLAAVTGDAMLENHYRPAIGGFADALAVGHGHQHRQGFCADGNGQRIAQCGAGAGLGGLAVRKRDAGSKCLTGNAAQEAGVGVRLIHVRIPEAGDDGLGGGAGTRRAQVIRHIQIAHPDVGTRRCTQLFTAAVNREHHDGLCGCAVVEALKRLVGGLGGEGPGQDQIRFGKWGQRVQILHRGPDQLAAQRLQGAELSGGKAVQDRVGLFRDRRTAGRHREVGAGQNRQAVLAGDRLGQRHQIGGGWLQRLQWLDQQARTLETDRHAVGVPCEGELHSVVHARLQTPRGPHTGAGIDDPDAVRGG